MNKHAPIDAIADKTGTTKTAASEQVDALIWIITIGILNYYTVKIVGFGSFRTGSRATRIGRKPSTGEEIQIAASRGGPQEAEYGWIPTTDATNARST